MALKDIQALDIEDINNLKGNDKKLIDIARDVQKLVNRRIDRLNQLPGGSAALDSVNRSGGKISAKKSMSRNQLIKEIVRGKNFLDLKTSTVSGAKRVVKEQEKRGLMLGTDPARRKSFWELYNKVKENPEQAAIISKLGSAQVQKMVFEEYTSNEDVNETYDKMVARLTEEYEKSYEVSFVYDTYSFDEWGVF